MEHRLTIQAYGDIQHKIKLAVDDPGDMDVPTDPSTPLLTYQYNLFGVYETVNNIRHGQVIVYNYDGSIHCIGSFNNDKLHGEYNEYENDIKIKTINYVNGVQHGNRIKYEDDKKTIFPMWNGKIHGDVFVIYANGKQHKTATYIHGELQHKYGWFLRLLHTCGCY